ncbi:phage holin family protein [Bacillus sp. BRMEA1]|uniref:phage holin family protein n=1 Tax=Neobacillus endophyticus TaxID=2738405 RepID=UPI00156613CD|nr:phage holin family protein [Neobacillus endophyticus]NRD79478.1 phage holin family protein [Neobacillus endophyticus]
MTGWMLYTLWAVLGLMVVDFVVGFFRSIVTKTFTPKIGLDYLKDILYYVLPLIFISNLMSVDPSGWILMVFYYICGIAVIWHYLVSIFTKWKA